MRKIIFLVLLTLFFVPKVHAEGEFATSYDVLYDVDTSEITTVTQKIKLKNLTSEYYANQFKLTVGATDVFDIKVSDPGGAMEVSTEQVDTSTQITVKFNQQVAGLNKELPWTLQFKSKDFAQNLGKVWEIRAPKISSMPEIEDYNLTISVPNIFGEPTLISPTPKSQTSSGGKMFLIFEKDQLVQNGVSAIFGNTQIFDFDLIYHLENKNLFPILVSIALPPDTAYQDVRFGQLEPAPINVTVDTDGNYLAWYRLKQGERYDVRLIGSAKLYTQSKLKNPTLSDELRKKYTQSDKFWEVSHPSIKSVLSEILGPDDEVGEKAEKIYQYVVDTLKYNADKLSDAAGVQRLGAVTALSNSDLAICMEFTDLFITLSRAAGIPARELNGYAYSTNTTLRPLSLSRDILHAWPEYWDDALGWVMIDPTWGNTTGGVDYFNKLDLNHFVFAIKGSSSSYPIPAGSYKYIGKDSRDVKISLSETDFLETPQLDVKIEGPDTIWGGFPQKIKVIVSNVGNSVHNAKNFKVFGQKISILGGKEVTLGPIPPFGHAAFEFDLRTSLTENIDDTITVLIGSQTFTKDVTVRPFPLFQTYPALVVGLILLMGLAYLLILGGHLYLGRRKKGKKK